MSYDLPWSNASNSPFKLFKSWVHEGGISTPFIAHWPAAMTALSVNDIRKIHHSPWVIMDIVATCIELGGIAAPDNLEGESFLSILNGKTMHLSFDIHPSTLTLFVEIKVRVSNANNQYFGSTKETVQ